MHSWQRRISHDEGIDVKSDSMIGSAVRIGLLALTDDSVSGRIVVEGDEFILVNDRLSLRDLARYVEHLFGRVDVDLVIPAQRR